jgi:hypothetical protein
MGEVTLELLQELIVRGLDEQRGLRSEQQVLRREVSEMRSLVLSVSDQVRRMDRHVAEVRDDIELMVKAELMGRLGHFEAQLEHRLQAIEARLPTA